MSLRKQNKMTVTNTKALRINDQPDNSKLTAYAKLSELQEITSKSEIHQRNLIEADIIFKSQTDSGCLYLRFSSDGIVPSPAQ